MATKKNAAAMPADGDAKKKALQTAISQIERDFGAGAVMRLGENDSVVTFARTEHVRAYVYWT